NAGKDGRIRSAIADRHVAVMIGSETREPTIQGRIRSINLLLHRRRSDCPTRHIDLRPLRTHGRARVSLDTVRDPQRFNQPHLSVLRLLHQTLPNRLHAAGVRLWDVIGRIERSLADLYRSAQSSAGATDLRRIAG